jgi:hypothetical protein
VLGGVELADWAALRLRVRGVKKLCHLYLVTGGGQDLQGRFHGPAARSAL